MAKINIIRREGGSRVLSVSSVIPKDWIAVQMTKLSETKKVVTIQLEKVK